MKMIIAISPTNLVTNSLLSFFFVLLKKQKIRIKILAIGGLITKHTSVFCLYHIMFKSMPNSVDVYEIIILDVISFRIIVPSSSSILLLILSDSISNIQPLIPTNLVQRHSHFSVTSNNPLSPLSSLSL